MGGFLQQLPEIKFHPQKGVNINIGMEQLHSLLGMVMPQQGQDPRQQAAQQMQQRPPQGMA